MSRIESEVTCNRTKPHYSKLPHILLFFFSIPAAIIHIDQANNEAKNNNNNNAHMSMYIAYAFRIGHALVPASKINKDIHVNKNVQCYMIGDLVGKHRRNIKNTGGKDAHILSDLI